MKGDQTFAGSEELQDIGFHFFVLSQGFRVTEVEDGDVVSEEAVFGDEVRVGLQGYAEAFF